jgi:SAM-dependent methyltransferase
MQQFLLGMHLSSLPMAQELASHLPLSTPRRVLDLGGGLGTYALAICQRFAEATATVLELPQVAAIGARLVAGSALAERIRFLGGDYLADPFPSGNDLILMCNILHQEKLNAVKRLFRKAAASLIGAGWIIILETLLDNESCSLAVALANLNSLLYYGSRNYSEGEIVKWLEAEGLVVRETRHTTEPGVRIIIAQQPDR